MRSHLVRLGLVALVAFLPARMPAQTNAGDTQSDAVGADGALSAEAIAKAQPADPPRRDGTRRSGSPALQMPAGDKQRLPIRRPKNPRPRDPVKDGPLAPPDSMVVYTPSTGEVRFEKVSPEYKRALKKLADSTPSSPGRLGIGPSKETIIGVDERVVIDDTRDFPWRVVGKINMDFPNPPYFWVASGALIGDFHALTAGHAIYNSQEGGWVTQLEFVPGMDENYAPFSSAWDVEVRIPPEYFNAEDPDYDWGIVTLDRNIGKVIGYFGYAYEQLNYYTPDKTFSLTGYPGDRDNGLRMYTASKNPTRATNLALYHVIDSAAGQSGSPIWRFISPDEYHIMAVHTYGDDSGIENSGSIINPVVFDALQTWWLGGDGGDPDLIPFDWADLIDDGLEFAGFSPTSVSPGTQFEVHSDVRNIGTTATAGFLVSYYLSVDQVITDADRFIGSSYVQYLESFEPFVTCSWQGPFPAGIPFGTYYVGWIIDSANTVDEINEDDNVHVLNTPLIVGSLPNIYLVPGSGDVQTAAGPLQVSPGTPILLSALLQNTGGSDTGGFWFEFWGSRTGGLMTDLFLADSARVSSIGPGQFNSYTAWSPLLSVPDGPYTVVLTADRPNEVEETDDTDNRIVLGGMRIVVLRPQTNADLVIQGFSFGPNPVFSGQPIFMNGLVTNVGTDTTGPFWIEFWASADRLYPSMDYFLCDSIDVDSLAPSQSINLASYPRTLYNIPAGTYMAGIVVDRIDQVNELNETNNYVFLDGQRLNMTVQPQDDPPKKDISKMQQSDLVVTSADFSPFSPFQAVPGTLFNVSARIENLSATPSNPVWVEYWGSRTGGLTLDAFIANSSLIGGIGPWGALDLNVSIPLNSVPDGPYSVVVVVDRPQHESELFEGNNRYAVAGKRLLTIRPQTQADIVVSPSFSVLTDPIRRGQRIDFTGQVSNDGTENTGVFWIEFLGTFTPNDPHIQYFLCDSILVQNLGPGQWIDLSTIDRFAYTSLPTGPMAPICFADRTDLVNETHEENNYQLLSLYTISP